MIHLDIVNNENRATYEVAAAIVRDGWNSAQDEWKFRREDNPHQDPHMAALWDAGFRWAKAEMRWE